MNGVSEGGSDGIRRLRPRTSGGWIALVCVVGAFAILDGFVLAGSDFALKLLVSLAGLVLGLVAAYATSHPFRHKFVRSGAWRLGGIFAGLALVFGIIYGGAALAGIPAFPTAGNGNIGNFIYGVAFGVGISIPKRFGLAPTHRKTARSEGIDPKVLAVLVGIPAGLFALVFAGYVVGRFVISPIIRYLVA